jgi:hypothetical protein
VLATDGPFCAMAAAGALPRGRAGDAIPLRGRADAGARDGRGLPHGHTRARGLHIRQRDGLARFELDLGKGIEQAAFSGCFCGLNQA